MGLIDFILAAIATAALWSVASATEDAADELARIRALMEEEEYDEATD
jgi:hypothetical protein